MNNGAKTSLVLMAGLAIALCTGVAQAQLTVALTSPGTTPTSPGSNVSAGSFTITNSLSAITDVTITSVTISISNLNLFSSIQLIAPDNTTAQLTTSPQTVTYSDLTALLPGQADSFSLTATIASSAATPTPTSDSGGIAFASIVWPHNNAASRTILTVLGLFAVGMLWLDGRLKRRHLAALAIALVLAATEVGCGNCSGSIFGCNGSSTGTGSSDQKVTAINATPSGLSITGVPLDLGTITSQ